MNARTLGVLAGAGLGLGAVVAMVLTGGAVVTVSQPAPATATNGALTLYVATTGNDSNSCLAVGQECATIQGAVDKVPKRIAYPVVINVAAGSYAAGAYIEGFDVEAGANPTLGAYLAIVGSYSSAITPTTGPGSGTATGGSAGTSSTTTWGTLVLSGAGWTGDDLKGKIVRITGGTGSGAAKFIYGNTSDTITVMGTWTAPTATSTFEIVDLATVVGVGLQRPATYGTASSSNSRAFVLEGNRGAQGRRGFFIQNIEVQDTVNGTKSASGIMFAGADLDVTRVRFADIGYPLYSTNDGTLTSVDTWVTNASYAYVRSRLDGVTATITAQYFNASGSFIEQFNIGGTLTLWYSSVTIGGTGAGFVNLPRATILGSRFACATKDYCIRAYNGTSVQITGCDVINSAVALSAGEYSFMSLSNVSGTGNTVGLSASRGARVTVSSNTTLTGTTEISIDGVSSDLATLRAASPKVLKDANYGTVVME